MKKITEEYLINRIKELEKSNAEHVNAMVGKIAYINSLNEELKDLRELVKYFAIDDIEPKRIVTIDTKGSQVGTIVWHDDDGYTHLREILERIYERERN